MVDRDYTEDQMKELLDLRARVMSVRKGKDDGMAIFKWLKELYYARIPQDYWGLSLPLLEVDPPSKVVTLKFTRNIHNAVKGGLGIAYLGNTGVGKTSMMCEVGKSAIIEGFSVVYITLEGYMACERGKDENRRDELLYKQVWGSDMVLMDEVDKAYIKQGSSWVTKKFVDLIKGTTPNGRAMLMAMNCDEDELRSIFGDAIHSALQRKLKFLPVMGHDHSEQLQQDWVKRLEGGQSLVVTENMVNQSSEFHKRQGELMKQKYDEVW